MAGHFGHRLHLRFLGLGQPVQKLLIGQRTCQTPAI